MSSNNNNAQPSTLQSYVDAATGAVQSAVGSVLGNNGEQAKGDANKEKAQAEYDASHATVKLPGVTASSSGAVTADDPDRSAGSWNQTLGSAKEFAGGLVGSEVSEHFRLLYTFHPQFDSSISLTYASQQSLKQAGRDQNASGREQEARGQVNDYTSGIADRVTGTLGGAAAGLTGNTAKQAQYQEQHDVGKTQQRGVGKFKAPLHPFPPRYTERYC